ncbi:ribonuclease III [Yunchengibacter salinarum]|uniref:ribonuclease III n=1 Tax=Yunchengibacter salinarum TaxID=3133399 RepID=UPI0035B6A8EE
MTRMPMDAVGAPLPGAVADHVFADPALLREALTHPSLSGRHNYQRLEFLGDRVLGLIVADRLLHAFPDENEGKLNRRLSSLVRQETLADVAEASGLVAHILLTPGAEAEGTRGKAAVQADVVEAVIGALYQDGGFQAAARFIDGYWADRLHNTGRAVKDNKTRLQEFCHATGQPLPVYEVVERSGPDHDPRFVVRVALGPGGQAATAEGGAKRAAEMAAAGALLADLGDGADMHMHRKDQSP